jgi:hypothetical protein
LLSGERRPVDLERIPPWKPERPDPKDRNELKSLHPFSFQQFVPGVDGDAILKAVFWNLADWWTLGFKNAREDPLEYVQVFEKRFLN